MSLGVTSYELSLFIHIAAAIVGLGVTFAEAFTYPVAMRLDPRHSNPRVSVEPVDSATAKRTEMCRAGCLRYLRGRAPPLEPLAPLNTKERETLRRLLRKLAGVKN